MRKPNKANPTEAVILASLLHGEKYGIEIRNLYEQRTGTAMPLGSLYVTLDRMEDKGFLKSRSGDPKAGRGGNRRKFYKITGSGVQALNALKQMLEGGKIQGGLANA